jgi:FkbM family methyltransferase
VSAFGTQIRTYVHAFGLSRRDAVRLAACYPLFKVAHEAEYASGSRRRISRAVARMSYGFTLRHEICGPGGPVRLGIKFSPSDLASFREVFWGRAYPAVLASASTFVDIGANTGMATCFFCTQYDLRRVLAVEGSPAMAEVLNANTAELPATIEIAMVAVSDMDGVADFTVNENHRHSGFGIDGSATHRVPTRTLRSLLDDHAFTEVDILKMDVEGAEHRILLCDPTILTRVRCLLMETHNGRAQRDDLVRLVEAQGFSVDVERGNEVDTVVALRRDVSR